jgi:RHS repeat-associated protein
VDQWAYDAAGNVLNDTNSGYEYDAEGRETGSYNQLNGLTDYIYDAEGRRAMKVLVNGFGTPQATTTVEAEYLLGLNGEQISVLGGAGNWLWTNVYAGGKQLATYDNTGTHFALTDWLGTKRAEVAVQVSGSTATATLAEICASMPFGDNLVCQGSDPNQLHFTGKQRDTESTNDYFGARFYASNIAGRFLTPDTPLVDQKPGDPQSWNLYAYVRNNPLANVDPTGQDCGGASSVATGSCAVDQLSGIFVGGIIDGNSINLASQSDSLTLMYTPDGQQAQQQNQPPATQNANSQTPPLKYDMNQNVPPLPATGPILPVLKCMQTCSKLVVSSTSEDTPVHKAGTPHRLNKAADLEVRPGQEGATLKCAAQCGAHFGLNERLHPSAHSTGAHVHIQVTPGRRGGRGDLPPQSQ